MVSFNPFPGIPSCETVQFSHSVVSDSLWSHGLQHTRLPCPSPTPGAYSNSCPSHQWCRPTISSSVVPFSSHLQPFPASGSFPMSQFFASSETTASLIPKFIIILFTCIINMWFCDTCIYKMWLCMFITKKITFHISIYTYVTISALNLSQH